MKKTTYLKRSMYIPQELHEFILDLSDAQKRSYSQTVNILLEKGREEVEKTLMQAPLF